MTVKQLYNTTSCRNNDLQYETVEFLKEGFILIEEGMLKNKSFAKHRIPTVLYCVCVVVLYLLISLCGFCLLSNKEIIRISLLLTR